MKLEYHEYKTKKIVNVHKHVDGPWFWGKYTAHPYVGCRSGCEFCYCRGGRYAGRRDPDKFDTLIGVKINAVDRLRVELPRLPDETITCGDWQQPAETRYRLSREMLKVVLENDFPLFIVERSPFITRDVDILVDINNQSWVGVVFSISSLDPVLKRVFEPRSPGVKRRLQAMSQLASAGILVGTSLMPIIPVIGDDKTHIEAVVKATKDHGGKFVLGGGLTMSGVQAQRTLMAVARLDPALETKWRSMYNWRSEGEPSYSPPREYTSRLGYLVRDLCTKHDLADRMLRFVRPGPLALNKRIAERLFLRTYDLELEMASNSRIWAYRRAAWTVDEHTQSVATIYEDEGIDGLRNLPGIGNRIANQIISWMPEIQKHISEDSSSAA